MVCVILASLLNVSHPSAASGESTDARSLYERGKELLDARKSLEAKTVFEELLDGHPDYHRAYPLYWRALTLEKQAETLRASAAAALERFEQTPRRKRDEDFYLAYLRACSLLEVKDRAESMGKEAIARFPSGAVARGDRYRAAMKEAEKDPLRAADHLKAVIDDYYHVADSAPFAALSRLGIIADHPDLFDLRSLQAAAAQSEGLFRVNLTSGDPGGAYWYVVATRRIAGALAERSPDESLRFAAKGLACLEEHWPGIDAFDENERVTFWPPMLRAYASSGKWDEARKIGETMLRHLEGDALPDAIRSSIDEAKVRSDLAKALEKRGAAEEAREQIGLAASLDESFRKEFDEYQGRNPIDPVERRKFETALAAKRSALQRRRDDRVRRNLLATEVQQTAPVFKARDLDGRTVTLGDFRGKAVVMSPWATWCGPCVWEMQHLEIAYKRYRGNPKVAFAAVSVDWDRDKVAPFVREKKYSFPILIAEGTFEKDYGIQSIPQMFIIDPRGRIRFRLEDLLEESYFQKSVDWMIEAALK